LTVSLFHKGQILSHLPVSKGVKDRVGLAPKEDGALTILVSQKENVSFKIKSPDQQEAPIQLDQKLGDAIISDQKNILKTVPLYTTEKIQRAGSVKIALQTFEFVIAKHKVSLLVIIIFICILGLQALYIVRLRKRLKDRPGDENIIKERLDKILLKPTDVD
jgi:hypothetical protein